MYGEGFDVDAGVIPMLIGRCGENPSYLRLFHNRWSLCERSDPNGHGSSLCSRRFDYATDALLYSHGSSRIAPLLMTRPASCWSKACPT